jgi:hypothetical protein
VILAVGWPAGPPAYLGIFDDPGGPGFARERMKETASLTHDEAGRSEKEVP